MAPHAKDTTPTAPKVAGTGWGRTVPRREGRDRDVEPRVRVGERRALNVVPSGLGLAMGKLAGLAVPQRRRCQRRVLIAVEDIGADVSGGCSGGPRASDTGAFHRTGVRRP